MKKWTVENISKGKKAKPPKLVLYGVPGIGKSSFAAKAPGTIFIDTEGGLDHLDVAKFPVAKTFIEVCDALEILGNETTEFKTVVVDTIDWLEKLIQSQVCKQERVNDISEIGYGKGPKLCLPLWNYFLQKLDEIIQSKRMSVILIAHSLIKTFNAPDTQAYDRYQLDLDPKAGATIMEWADAVLFVNYRIFTQEEKGKFGATTTKAVGQGERIMYTERRPAFEAKNRYSLPASMAFDYDQLQSEISKIYL
jgi:hypothetical protein